MLTCCRIQLYTTNRAIKCHVFCRNHIPKRYLLQYLPVCYNIQSLISLANWWLHFLFVRRDFFFIIWCWAFGGPFQICFSGLTLMIFVNLSAMSTKPLRACNLVSTGLSLASVLMPNLAYFCRQLYCTFVILGTAACL